MPVETIETMRTICEDFSDLTIHSLAGVYTNLDDMVGNAESVGNVKLFDECLSLQSRVYSYCISRYGGCALFAAIDN